MMAFEGTGLAAMRSFSVMVTMHKADGAGLCSLYCRGVVAVRFKCERCVNEFRTEDLLKGHYSACDLEVPKILQDLASGKENKPLTETVSYEKGEEKEKYLSEGKCSAESNTCVENACGGTGGNSVKERTVDFESEVNPKKCGLSESKKLISAKISEKASDSSGSAETDNTLKSSTNFPRLDEEDSINAETMQDNAGKSSSKNEQDSCSRLASNHGDEKVEETASSKVIGDLAGKKMGGVISKTGELSSNSSVVISKGSSTPAKESKTTTEEGTAGALDSFVGSRDHKLHSKDLSTSSTDSSAAQGSISGVQEDGSKIGASADGDQSLKDSVSCAIDRVAAGYSMAVPKDRTPRVNPAELMKKIDKSGVSVLGSFQDRNKLYVIVRKKEDTVADPPPKRYVIQNVHEKTKGIPIPSGVELGIQRCSVTTKQGNSDAPLDKSMSGTNVVSREKRTKRLLGKRRGGSAGTIRRSTIKKKKPEGEMENSEKNSNDSAPKEGDSKKAAPKIVKPKRMRKPWRRSKQMCHLCGRVMSSQTSLKQHLMIHNGVKNFCCALCNKKFTHKQSLKVHQKIHRGERDFACKVCGKTFTRAGDCVQHEKLHEGSEKVVCDQCGKLCKTKKHLMYHMRIHDDDKRYKCEFCGIKFLYHGTYKTHLLNHTGERPYVCATCGKGFKNSSKLRRHNEVHIKREGATYHNYCKVEKEEPSHITYHNYCKVQKK